MTWEKLLAYCLAKPGAWQDEPWEGDVVAKVGGKIFAFLSQNRRNARRRSTCLPLWSVWRIVLPPRVTVPS